MHFKPESAGEFQGELKKRKNLIKNMNTSKRKRGEKRKKKP